MDGVRDAISGLPVALDVAHHIVHLGYNFEVHHERRDTGFDTGEVMDLLIVTGAQAVHCTWEAGVFGGRASLAIVKDPTYVSAGTGLTAYNSNDESNATCPFTATHTPTSVSGGTGKGLRLLFGSTSGQAKTGAQVRSGGEKILARNSAYLFRMTALDDNIQGFIDFSGYGRVHA